MKPKTEVVKTDGAKTNKKALVARSVGAVIAGAAIGYVAGALTAPASGRETRRRISQRVEEEAKGMARKAKRSLATAKGEAKDLGRKAKKSLTRATDKLADKLHS
ncbi:MAG: YtxH domain-containing protein [Vicinamibacteria bacterium]|nr:YtxH domain-containing protein [Vicinamibacteria bacterium]